MDVGVLQYVAEQGLHWLLHLGPSLLLPTLCCWALARYVLGVSLTYLFLCLYLELQLKARRAISGSTSSAGNDCFPSKLAPEERLAELRGVKVVSVDSYTASGQTVPPSKRVSVLYQGAMPAGEESNYSFSGHRGRRPREEAALGALEDDAWQQRLRCLREGAEVHRQVRQHVQRKVRPGMELKEIVEMVEKGTSTLVGFDAKHPLGRGWAFPTGLSLNEVAAHDTVNPGDPSRWLKSTDLMKLDFGVQVEGHILDCAFSLSFNPMHDELMRAVQEATEEGIRNAGPDALVSEIGGCIREVMEAAEVHRPDGRVLPVKSIKNLTGHSILPYKIHAGKSLPSVNTGGNVRMLCGELWAIETFGSAGGVGYVTAQGDCSHFMRPASDPPGAVQRCALSKGALSLLDIIDRRFGTLAFCPRWVVQEAAQCKSPLLKGCDHRWWSAPLNELCNMGVVTSYPPLADLPGSHTAQYEHTILLGPRCKEVLTRGTDY